MHSSEKHRSVKFDEYKFLDNQIDWLPKVIHKINTRSLRRQNQQDTPYRPYIHRDKGGGHRNYPNYEHKI